MKKEINKYKLFIVICIMCGFICIVGLFFLKKVQKNKRYESINNSNEITNEAEAIENNSTNESKNKNEEIENYTVEEKYEKNNNSKILDKKVDIKNENTDIELKINSIENDYAVKGDTEPEKYIKINMTATNKESHVQYIKYCLAFSILDNDKNKIADESVMYNLDTNLPDSIQPNESATFDVYFREAPKDNMILKVLLPSEAENNIFYLNLY